MFKWLAVLVLVSGKCLSVGGQTVRAEKRVINTGPGLDYNYQQFVTGHPGLQAYSDFGQKPTESTSAGELPKNIRTIIVTKKVPVPYPVHVQKNIPYPVKVPVRRPYTVYVPRPYYVEVMKQVPFPVKVPIPQPYTVEKHVPVPYKVHYDKPYPVHVSKPYPVYYEKRVPIHIQKPVPFPYKVPVDRPYPVHTPFENPVLYPVERPYPFPLKVPVEKPVATNVEKPIPVTVEKPQLASNEHSMTAEYYSSTQPTVHNTFSPSQYDEMTSSLITQGKHKVISFLPGSPNNLGSYGDHSDIGTIHVSNIKGGGGNSTDWVPKPYVPNSQYLTYIPPNTQHKFQYQYIVPEKVTKLNPVSNAQPYIVKHNSVKMHYKLHFDPVKQEYSFQLMPRPPGADAGGHNGFSYQSLKSENKQQPMGTSDPQHQYFYKPAHEHSSGAEIQPTAKPVDGLTYSFQNIQGKPEFSSVQSGPDSQALTYSYQTNHHQYKPAHDHSSGTEIQPTAKPGDGLTYSFQNIQGKPEFSSVQSGPDSQALTYSYQTNHHQYKPAHDHSSGAEIQPTAKPGDGFTYSFQNIQGKPEFSSVQSGSDSQGLTYSYQNQQQDSNVFKQEGAYTFQNVDAAAKPLYDTSGQVSGHQPEVSYTYESVQHSPEKQGYQQEQSQHPSQPQITYSYSVDNGGKLGYEFQTQPKNHEIPQGENVRYVYVPRTSVENAYAESRDTSNLQPTYTISTEQNEGNTEYPQILYQQGRIATILRDQFGYTESPLTDQGKIPENFKSSRASEDIMSYNNYENENSSSEVFTNVKKDQSVRVEAGSGYHIENVHPFNQSNEGEKLGGTSSITFQKFGVGDVMTTGRTRLYPVNETSSTESLSTSHEGKVDPYKLRSEYRLQSTRDNYEYLQRDETTIAPTEHPFNTKVYRLPSYKVPKSKKGNRRRNNKDNSRMTTTTEDHTQSYDEDRTTTVQWYEVFSQDSPEDTTTKKGSSSKETNSHTGAAERAPFYGYHTTTASATTTTTTSNSLLPPDDAITALPTESIRKGRGTSRGSVRAYGRKKEAEATTDAGDATTTKATRRRRRPGARRRSDRVKETPTEEVEQ